jgi:hypothetical protein
MRREWSLLEKQEIEMNKSNTNELTIDELDLVSGGKISGGWVGGFWFAHDTDSGVTTVGAGNTFVSNVPNAPGGPMVVVVKT